MAPDNARQDPLTVDDLVARATALGPKLAERRNKAQSLRRLPDETVADLIDNDLVRACQPKRFGGPELPFGTHTDVAMELARYCPSTGWVAGILGSHDCGGSPSAIQTSRRRFGVLTLRPGWLVGSPP